jgi:hypothetical protein
MIKKYLCSVSIWSKKLAKEKHILARPAGLRTYVTWLVRRPQPWSYSRPVADQQPARTYKYNDWWSSDFWRTDLGLEPTGRGVTVAMYSVYWLALMLTKQTKESCRQRHVSTKQTTYATASGAVRCLRFPCTPTANLNRRPVPASRVRWQSLPARWTVKINHHWRYLEVLDQRPRSTTYSNGIYSLEIYFLKQGKALLQFIN